SATRHTCKVAEPRFPIGHCELGELVSLLNPQKTRGDRAGDRAACCRAQILNQNLSALCGLCALCAKSNRCRLDCVGDLVGNALFPIEPSSQLTVQASEAARIATPKIRWRFWRPRLAPLAKK